MFEYAHPLDSLRADSTGTLKILPTGPYFDLGDTTRFSMLPGPYQDRVQRDLYRQQLGHEKPVPLNKAIGQGAKYLSDLFSKNKKEKPVRLDFVPSEAEIDILQTLWQQPKSTDVEIYAALDTSIHLAATDINEILQQLAQKGLVERQLVSPRNEFTFPLGAVEMSAKNRKNRVYQYESRIDVDEVMRYLQAVLYNAEHGQTSSDSSNSKFVASLKKKILRLLESSG
jgi:predicted transcriptional regulator